MRDFIKSMTLIEWLIVSVVVGIILAISLPGIDRLVFERRAFRAITACEARRMEARRKIYSSEVVCVPAYRTTKTDTLTLQGIK